MVVWKELGSGKRRGNRQKYFVLRKMAGVSCPSRKVAVGGSL